MIEIKNGRVFVDGKETTDATLIGYALLDAAEGGQELETHLDSAEKIIRLIDNEVELQLVNEYLNSNMASMCIPRVEASFNINWFSSQILIDLIGALKSEILILNPIKQNGKSAANNPK